MTLFAVAFHTWHILAEVVALHCKEVQQQTVKQALTVYARTLKHFTNIDIYSHNALVGWETGIIVSIVRMGI